MSQILSNVLQIIQSEGSYSFLLCGMIIGCIGFVLFFGLLFFERLHRNYLTGMLTTNNYSNITEYMWLK